MKYKEKYFVFNRKNKLIAEMQVYEKTTVIFTYEKSYLNNYESEIPNEIAKKIRKTLRKNYYINKIKE